MHPPHSIQRFSVGSLCCCRCLALCMKITDCFLNLETYNAQTTLDTKNNDYIHQQQWVRDVWFAATEKEIWIRIGCVCNDYPPTPITDFRHCCASISNTICHVCFRKANILHNASWIIIFYNLLHLKMNWHVSDMKPTTARMKCALFLLMICDEQCIKEMQQIKWNVSRRIAVSVC